MKLVTSVVQAYDADKLLRDLTSQGYGSTRIGSIGGFLRMANATILCAVREEDVPEVVNTIRSHCSSRVEVKMDDVVADYFDVFPAGYHEVTVGGAVVFVLPVGRMVRIYPDRVEAVS